MPGESTTTARGPNIVVVTGPEQATAGLLVREATALDAHALAHVYVSSWRAAYRGIVEDEVLERMSVERQEASYGAWFRRHPPSSFIRVAVDAGANVVGFGIAGEARAPRAERRGEVYVLYLLPQVQRRGIGTRLFASLARGLDLRGMDSMVVWALERNPARAFYARLGGRAGEERQHAVGTRSLTEVCYAWDALEEVMVAR